LYYLAELLRAIDGYRSAPTTAYALKLASRTLYSRAA
jgi:hypothetical protein